jgi:hypothetical protein
MYFIDVSYAKNVAQRINKEWNEMKKLQLTFISFLWINSLYELFTDNIKYS